MIGVVALIASDLFYSFLQCLGCCWGGCRDNLGSSRECRCFLILLGEEFVSCIELVHKVFDSSGHVVCYFPPYLLSVGVIAEYGDHKIR